MLREEAEHGRREKNGRCGQQYHHYSQNHFYGRTEEYGQARETGLGFYKAVFCEYIARFRYNQKARRQNAGKRAHSTARPETQKVNAMSKETNDESTTQQTMESLARLKDTSNKLREKIEEEKRRRDMPIDSALGNPEEEVRNADGRLDLPDNEDD
jgi:DNA anti-recombination protein RmuC